MYNNFNFQRSLGVLFIFIYVDGESGRGNNCRSFSKNTHVRMVCGPSLVKAGKNPWQLECNIGNVIMMISTNNITLKNP